MTSAGCNNIAMLTVDTDCGCGRNTECNYELLQRTFDMFAVNIVMTATQTGPRNWASGPGTGGGMLGWRVMLSCWLVCAAVCMTEIRSYGHDSALAGTLVMTGTGLVITTWTELLLLR